MCFKIKYFKLKIEFYVKKVGLSNGIVLVIFASMFNNEDTIAAIITPAGVGAVSIIRVSGNHAIQSVDKIFIGKKKLSESSSHTIHYGKLLSSESSVVDDVLVSIFLSPNSYTGEDVVEISYHGSPVISQKIMTLLFENEVRSAEPGEFTKRAFLNNKIDLAQAEAVASIINSRTSASLRGARNQLDGILSNAVNNLRSKIINSVSLVELELDFAEEDVEFIERGKLLEMISEIHHEIEKLLSTYSFGKILNDGFNVALVGEPNVGKSALLNYILKENRAIVSEIPGTTRDIIREEVSIDGILFRFFDTAGIRSASDEIETEGVSRTRKIIAEADLIIFIEDAIAKSSEDINLEINKIEPQKLLRITNKVDLLNSKTINGIFVSAKTGEGMKELLEILKQRVNHGESYTEKSAVISNQRHFIALQNCSVQLKLAEESIKNNLSGEFVSVDLRKAADSLGEIIGIVTTDDILNNIFSKFCIGK